MGSLNKTSQYRTLPLFLGLGIVLASLTYAMPARAASFFLSPSSGSHTVGRTFTVSVYVSSPDQAENATQGDINFPANKLEATTISKSGSIITLWVTEPSYSNTDGVVHFAGITPNPGFTGQSGKILTITFRVKDAGNAHLEIAKGSVLANDGLGTQILTQASGADFSLENKIPVTPTAEESQSTGASGTPFAPQISSRTHPNPNEWYSNANASFSWQFPSDVTSARVGYDNNPNVYPAVVYSPAITEKSLQNLGDGIYYFSVQLKNKNGWGAISRFKFQIDTQAPRPFKLSFVDNIDTDNPQPKVFFNTTDALSGIAYYKLKIGDADFITVPADAIGNEPFVLPLQTPGKKSILVQAIDKASNATVASGEFTILSIKPPTITDYSKELNEGQYFIVKGKTYPNTIVTVYLQKDNIAEIKQQAAKSDENGNFSLIWDTKLSDDVYKFWADVTDQRGAKSEPSLSYAFVVRPIAIVRIGFLVITYAGIIIVLGTMLIVLVFSGWYFWHHLRRRLKKGTRNAEKSLHVAFNLLRENITANIRTLEETAGDRALTKEEEKIIVRAKKDLDNAETVINKELESIDKQLK